jgi:perosamine synthetase
MKKKFLAFGTPNYSYREIKSVIKVMRSKWLGMGQVSIDFEKKIENYLDANHCLLVSSCTDALFLSLKSLNIGPGDEVIVPSFTWCSTVNSIIYTGATPVFCDVELDTFNVDFSDVLKKITNKTKAVLVVHFGGLAVEVKKLKTLLPGNISIVEDAAHAFGSKYQDGSYVGSSGNLTCFSFYANKNLSTGDGGAITFQNDDKKEVIEKLRMNGLSKDAWSRFISRENPLVNPIESLGYKMNYTDLQASIGIVQLSRINKLVRKRNRVFQRYLIEFAKINIGPIFQSRIESNEHSKHLLTVLLERVDSLEKRNRLVFIMRKKGIGISVHYQPLHSQPFYQQFIRNEKLNNTDYIGDRIITLPISSSMKLKNVNKIIKTLNEVLSEF